MPRPSLVSRLLHPVALLGSLLFIVGLGASLVALTADLLRHEARPYQGLLTFVLYPGVMLTGLALLLAGLLLERRRRRRGPPREERDVSLLRHRGLLFGLTSFVVVFVAASIVGAYRAYEFTESEAFCGALCHAPMEPQATAHDDSPHANVRCTECHVGPGVPGYVEAKLAGVNQLIQMATDNWPRPIRAHTERVPGAHVTCAECHWPGKRVGDRVEDRIRYGWGPRSPRRPLRILLDVGHPGDGGDPGRGIHWHASDDVRVEYRATDELQLEIPWVRVTRADGSVTVYRRRPAGDGEPSATGPGAPDGESSPGGGPAADPDSATRGGEDAPAADGGRQAGTAGTGEEGTPAGTHPTRVLDCIGCHNRAAHRFRTAEQAVDRALAEERIDPTLPYAKKTSIEALGRAREAATSGDDPQVAIRGHLETFWGERLEGILPARKRSVDAMARTLAEIHRRNAFPNRGIDGTTYPDHSGHREWPGCMRCHGGRHVSDDGTVLSSECDLCHRFWSESPDQTALRRIPEDGSSLHPFGPDTHADVACWTCHAGRESPYAGCVECHDDVLGGPHLELQGCAACHVPGEADVPVRSCAPCHPTGDSPLHATPGHGECVDCHLPHDGEVDTPAACATEACHATIEGRPLAEHEPGQACTSCHGFGGMGAHLLGVTVPGRR